MKAKILFIIFTAAVLFWTCEAGAADSKSSVYERVMESGVLRCGYFEEAPFTIVDPNTKAMSGLAVALAELIARETRLKIEWVPMGSFATLTEELRQNKYDAICGSLFTLSRAGRVDYTIPYIYVPVKAYTQVDSKVPAFEKIDWPQTKIAGLDGEGATTIARERLATAQFFIMPELSSVSDMLTAVATKKADIAFVMPTVFAVYERHSPRTLKAVEAARAFHVFAAAFGVKPDETALKNMIDIVIRSLQASGELDDLIDQYDPDHLLYRPDHGYRTQ